LFVFWSGSFFSAFSGVVAEAQQSLIELNNLTTTYLNYTFDPTLNQSGMIMWMFFIKQRHQRVLNRWNALHCSRKVTWFSLTSICWGEYSGDNFKDQWCCCYCSIIHWSSLLFFFHTFTEFCVDFHWLCNVFFCY
jgi:hypothetical protein